MIRIYLLRHAIAVSRGVRPFPNDDRPLTDEGIKKMSRAVQGMRKIIDNVDTVLTSPLIRARGTAKIVAKALKMESRIEVCDVLSPGSSLKRLLLTLAKYKRKKTILLVGHEPDLSYLASALLGKNIPVIQFKKGSLCCIEMPAIPSQREGILLWHLTSRQLRMIAGKGANYVTVD